MKIKGCHINKGAMCMKLGWSSKGCSAYYNYNGKYVEQCSWDWINCDHSSGYVIFHLGGYG